MINPDVDKAVDEFLEKVGKHLPEGFETEDLLQELRDHIREGLLDKMRAHPDRDQMELLEEVLQDVGTPEMIAEEYSHSGVQEEKTESTSKMRFFGIRLIAFIIVGVPAAWYVSNVVQSIDFLSALVILLVFAVLESVLRLWQTEEDA